MPQQQIKPRYEVEKLEGEVKRTVYNRDKDAGVNTERVEKQDAGYMVYFPAGHSIRVKDEEELKRLGFDAPPELIDEDGDVVGTTQQLSLKKHVQRRVGASRKAATDSVDANVGD